MRNLLGSPVSIVSPSVLVSLGVEPLCSTVPTTLPTLSVYAPVFLCPPLLGPRSLVLYPRYTFHVQGGAKGARTTSPTRVFGSLHPTVLLAWDYF